MKKKEDTPLRKMFIRILSIQDSIHYFIDQNEKIKKGKWLFFSEHSRWKRINKNLHALKNYQDIELEAITELETALIQEKNKIKSNKQITEYQISSSKKIMDELKTKS